MIRRLLILPGASLPDRLLACTGAALGIAITGLVGHALMPTGALPWLVAPMGASAVLIFAVPASPLAQPWPVVGGNAIAALVGVTVARIMAEPHLAAVLAVGLAILAMSLARALHPPGGATALIAVIGGPAVTAAGYGYVLAPVTANAAVLTIAGVLFHRLSGHSYPHRPGIAPAPAPVEIGPEDIERALAEGGEALDADREDLLLLARRACALAAARGR